MPTQPYSSGIPNPDINELTKKQAARSPVPPGATVEYDTCCLYSESNPDPIGTVRVVKVRPIPECVLALGRVWLYRGVDQQGAIWFREGRTARNESEWDGIPASIAATSDEDRSSTESLSVAAGVFRAEGAISEAGAETSVETARVGVGESGSAAATEGTH